MRRNRPPARKAAPDVRMIRETQCCFPSQSD
jgi:hypothetical protein